MCKKQTSVSHSSIEAEVISLDASLRMDGIPALTLWDVVIEVFHSVPNNTDGPKREPRGNPSAIVKSNMHNPIPTKHTNVIPTNIDNIPSNTKNYDSSAVLCVFEDNEAVIKIIIKGRCPTVRHVSRTHRVALDWLFDRINLDPQIQIRYIDTKHLLADMLTEGNFTRGEWYNLLLLNISHFSSGCCTKNFSLIMSSYFIATSSSAASSPIASQSLGMPIASGKSDSRMSVEPSSFDAASTSQVRLKDAYFGGLMEEQRGDPSKKIQKTQTVLRLDPGTAKRNLLSKTIQFG